jgi:hypothetical protein
VAARGPVGNEGKTLILQIFAHVVERLYVVARVVAPGADVNDVEVLGVCAARAAAFSVPLASSTTVHNFGSLYGNIKRRRVPVPSRPPFFALSDQSLPVGPTG